jgi:tRNA/rRNA methyltransferase
MPAPDSIGTDQDGTRALDLDPALLRFVLVEPSHSGNIGAAARAIRTMGFRQLSVVAPRDRGYRSAAEAVALATHAGEVLRDSTCHDTLVDALQGVTLAFAMTPNARQFGPPHVQVRQAGQQAADWLRQGRGPLAFVFGTERSGLVNRDVQRCHYSCAIPADPRFGSLNLAQAVQVTAYEMRVALNGADPARAPPVASVASGGTAVETIERLFESFEHALRAIGFLDPDHPKHSMERLRSLLGRAGLTPSEADFLLGMCAAIVEPKPMRAGRKRARPESPAPGPAARLSAKEPGPRR